MTTISSSQILNDSDDSARLRLEYNALRDEHSRLDREIFDLESIPNLRDRLELQRKKKRKLQLKDRITELERSLFPNISA